MNSSNLLHREYRGLSKISGPLLFVRGASDLPYGALVDIVDAQGRHRGGQVIEVSSGFSVIQALEQSIGLDVVETTVSLVDHETRLSVSEDMIGRVFSGSGLPRDGLPPLVPDQRLPVSGMPINPLARAQPQDFIQTGISAVDGFSTLVRGQKLPLFSGSGLPGNEIAAQILRQAQIRGENARFLVVFAAIGITRREAAFYMAEFERTKARDRSVIFLNTAGDPTIERILTPASP